MKLEWVFFWAMFVLSIGVVLWLIFGKSPTLEQSLLVMIITFLFAIYGTLRESKIKTGLLEKKFSLMENSFTRLASDFKEHIKHRAR